MLFHHDDASAHTTAATLDFLVSRKQRDSGHSPALLIGPGPV